MINRKVTYFNSDRNLRNDLKKYSKIYDIHKYWSRKPWHPISNSIMKYSNENDLVVDLFLGSGVTALESILLNRNFIGFDLNPMSIFISENTISTDFDKNSFLKELNFIEKKLNKLVIELYFSKERCPICNSNLILQHANIGPKFKNNETGYFFCPNCGKNKTRVKRKLKPSEKSKEKYPIKKWVPETEFPSKFYKDRFSYKGITKVIDMFTPRNLYFLSELYDVIINSNLKYQNLFLLAFTNTLLHASKLKGENVRPLSVNNYWIPDDYFEENPFLRFKERVNKIMISKTILNERIKNKKRLGKAVLKNQSSLNTKLKDNSVDYIITDPPYGDAIQYSELSFIWNAWIKKEFRIEEEVIINPAQNKTVEDFLGFIDESVKEASRILKEDKFYTLCFHNKEFKIWVGVLNIFKKYDFVLENIDIVNTKGNSYNTNWARFNPKTDLYLTFRKKKFKPTHNKKYTIKSILRKIINTKKLDSISKIYDLLCVELINEIYFNKYQIDISTLTIKKLRSYVEEIKHGN